MRRFLLGSCQEKLTKKVEARLSGTITSIPGNNVFTLVDFTVEDFDSHGAMNSLTTFTATEPGRYLVIAMVQWSNNLASGLDALAIFKNSVIYAEIDANNGGATQFDMRNGSDVVDLVIGDTVEIFVKQGSGGSVSLNNGTFVVLKWN